VLLLLALLGIGVAIGAGVILYHWPEILDRVTQWLNGRGENLQHLRKSLLRLDRLLTTVRGRLIVQSSTSSETVIEEETLELAEIDDPDVRAALDRAGYLELDLLQEG